jgi:uncharacterized protein YaaR (DUF327 family)
MLDNKILENRLILRESSFVGSSVSRCASKFQALINSKRDTNTIEKSILDNFLREIELYKLDIMKGKNILDSFDNQLSSYDTVEGEVKSKISATEDNIIELERNFRNEKLIRLHREKLEAKGDEVKAYPSRHFLKRKIQNLEENISSAEDNIISVNHRISIRNKQFTSLLKSIEELQSKLIEDIEITPIENSAMEEDGEDDEIVERDNDRDHEDEKAVTKDTEDEGSTNENADEDNHQDTADIQLENNDEVIEHTDGEVIEDTEDV